ncbi:hypothetical protein LAV84_30145 [Rhizobium sp. VS19-DR104.2]|uniref:hypothetical protein n=1 Tax=unclassified Rhizobium TaxID=2613769 RepID=UPI001C5A84F4|nr:MULTISPECIES: hypothetical protein [unclassified Rhizobium]MBZ5763713.1 hypothetical protein [Rhizobium sp. VS19-DR96]MBZ5769642.1 hypothetical protein [Rhizobium sp. VS19-DR129.2]MBZ5777177.1 hypothetical protein [Rhizobium sp. VS19-DRK62.2]MBZ5788323.1 hypothetical protein [Rhizobium sp. VS19-DR121]MBZ5805776.1 hypothetical protein [Rhizobium sp. VS19-DR181]
MQNILGADETIRSLAFQHGILGVRSPLEPWSNDILGIPRRPLDIDMVSRILAALQRRGAVTVEQASALEAAFMSEQLRRRRD